MTFNGNTTAASNADANGIGAFKYAVPSGAKAICTSNLPEPTIKDPTKHVVAKAYNGTGAAQTVGVGFQPDLVMIKDRSREAAIVVNDAVRGFNSATNGSAKMWAVHSSDAETTSDTTHLTAFTSNGFTLGDNSDTDWWVNVNNYNYISWNFKMGNSTSANTDGSISSTVSVNSDAGMSIVSYTGTLSSAGTPTVGHGLGKVPNLIISKDRTNSNDNIVQHSSLSGSNVLDWNTDAVPADKNGNGALARTSSTFVANYTGGLNESGHTYIAYCFAAVEGFSDFGIYEGDGASGAVIHTGFRPAIVMVKRINGSGGSWVIWDTERESNNPANKKFFMEDASAENTSTSYNRIYFCNNGFKFISEGGNSNDNGGSYIYAAWAETPQKYATAY